MLMAVEQGWHSVVVPAISYCVFIFPLERMVSTANGECGDISHVDDVAGARSESLLRVGLFQLYQTELERRCLATK